MNHQKTIIDYHNLLCRRISEKISKMGIDSIKLNEPVEVVLVEYDHNGDCYYSGNVTDITFDGEIYITKENGDEDSSYLTDIVPTHQVAMLLDIVESGEFTSEDEFLDEE